jgi:hypothetical protein
MVGVDEEEAEELTGARQDPDEKRRSGARAVEVVMKTQELHSLVGKRESGVNWKATEHRTRGKRRPWEGSKEREQQKRAGARRKKKGVSGWIFGFFIFRINDSETTGK